MTFTVLDTATGMREVLTAPAGQREDRLRTMLTPMQDMYRYFPGEVDLVALHAMGQGFPLEGRSDEVLAALDQLEAADAWTRIEAALQQAAEVQRQALPDLVIPDVSVLLVLGNPDDEGFMGPARGATGNGSMSGYIQLTMWPTEENLARLEAAAVHELNHNLRYGPGGVVWDPAHVVVGEHVVSEGLADAFARQLYGNDLGYTPIGRPHLEDDAVFDTVLTGLDVGGMENFAAWVLGDEIAQRFGGAPVGVPTGGGYAAGNRLVDTYLAATSATAADALHVPSAEIRAATPGPPRRGSEPEGFPGRVRPGGHRSAWSLSACGPGRSPMRPPRDDQSHPRSRRRQQQHHRPRPEPDDVDRADRRAAEDRRHEHRHRQHRGDGLREQAQSEPPAGPRGAAPRPAAGAPDPAAGEREHQQGQQPERCVQHRGHRGAQLR